jgi:hypothetical protein
MRPLLPLGTERLCSPGVSNQRFKRGAAPTGFFPSISTSHQPKCTASR